ncbi:MAG: hypothetical protein WBE72_17985 [Terracidiphilus sp.]
MTYKPVHDVDRNDARWLVDTGLTKLFRNLPKFAVYATQTPSLNA